MDGFEWLDWLVCMHNDIVVCVLDPWPLCPPGTEEEKARYIGAVMELLRSEWSGCGMVQWFGAENVHGWTHLQTWDAEAGQFVDHAWLGSGVVNESTVPCLSTCPMYLACMRNLGLTSTEIIVDNAEWLRDLPKLPAEWGEFLHQHDVPVLGRRRLFALPC